MPKISKETLKEFQHTVDLILQTDKKLSKKSIIRLTELKERLSTACSKDKITKEEIGELIQLGVDIFLLVSSIGIINPPG